MSYREMFEVSKEDARNRLVTEIMQTVMRAEKMAEKAHERHDTQLKEIVGLRMEVERLNSVVKSLSDRMDAMREWAKTLDLKKKKIDE
jgi:predicted FMN-binding regulatory protein PaiB